MIEQIILRNPGYDFQAGLLKEFDEQDYKNPDSLNNYNKILNACKERHPEAGGYLGCRLHDSRFLSFDYSKDKSLKMTFNDYYYIDFSLALMHAEEIYIPNKKLVFPVTLEFSRIKKCIIYWCNRNNKLIPLKTEKYLPKIDEYLYDEIQEVGKDYLSVGFNFWTNRLKWPKKNLFMQIIAKDFSVQECQQKILFEIFGEKYHPLLKTFVKEIEKAKDFDVTVAGDFIRENKHLIVC